MNTILRGLQRGRQEAMIDAEIKRQQAEAIRNNQIQDQEIIGRLSTIGRRVTPGGTVIEDRVVTPDMVQALQAGGAGGGAIGAMMAQAPPVVGQAFQTERPADKSRLRKHKTIDGQEFVFELKNDADQTQSAIAQMFQAAGPEAYVARQKKLAGAAVDDEIDASRGISMPTQFRHLGLGEKLTPRLTPIAAALEGVADRQTARANQVKVAGIQAAGRTEVAKINDTRMRDIARENRAAQILQTGMKINAANARSFAKQLRSEAGAKPDKAKEAGLTKLLQTQAKIDSKIESLHAARKAIGSRLGGAPGKQFFINEEGKPVMMSGKPVMANEENAAVMAGFVQKHGETIKRLEEEKRRLAAIAAQMAEE